jgi:hypothetical protein
VSIVIWEAVEDYIAELASMEDVGLCIRLLGFDAE